MPFETEREKLLCEISKKFDEAISSHDYSKLDEILDDNVILHKDGIALRQDLKGKAALKDWLQSYSDKYTFLHECIAGSANPNNYVFSFWVDKNVTPKPEKFTTPLTEEETKPSQTCGMWHHHVGATSNKIEEVFFMRQLSRDEIKRKLKYDPHYEKLAIDPEHYKHSPLEPSKERETAMRAAMEKYKLICTTGDVKLADEIMTQDAREVDMVMAQELKGREEFKKKMSGLLQKWQPKSQIGHPTSTAGNKGFFFWLSEGTYKDSGEADTLMAIDMTVFDAASKIQEVICFLTPPKWEREKLVKEQVEY